MGVKCPTCGESLHTRLLLFMLVGDCWDCHKRYAVDIIMGTASFVTDFDEDGNAIESKEII